MTTKAMTLEDFESVCRTRKLEKDKGTLLDIQGKCCPQTPVHARYIPNTGLVTLTCAECGSEVLQILTASVTTAIYFQCLQAVVVEVEKCGKLPEDTPVQIPLELYEKIKEVIGIK